MRDAKAKNDLNYYILLRSSNIGNLGEIVASKRLIYQENVVLKSAGIYQQKQTMNENKTKKK